MIFTTGTDEIDCISAGCFKYASMKYYENIVIIDLMGILKYYFGGVFFEGSICNWKHKDWKDYNN